MGGSEKHMPLATKVLDKYFKERERLLKDKRMHNESSYLFVEARNELFANNEGFEDRVGKAIAFYNAQVQRFNSRVRDDRQNWKAESVEFHLEPAWRVCAFELCVKAAAGGGDGTDICFVNHRMRGHLHYRVARKPLTALLDFLRDGP